VVTKDELEEGLAAQRAKSIQIWVKKIDAILKKEYHFEPVTILFSKLPRLVLNEPELALARRELAQLYRVEGKWDVIETELPPHGPALIIG
jgi:hypothetical protein